MKIQYHLACYHLAGGILLDAHSAEDQKLWTTDFVIKKTDLANDRKVRRSVEMGLKTLESNLSSNTI